MAIANGFLTLNLRAEDAISFLFVTFEHLASCTKNLGDVYSVLLNGVWGFGLNRGAINLTNVLGCARRKNAHHGVVALVDPMIGNDASWWSVASNIRNESQHMDATSILTTPVGRPLNPSNIRNRVIHPLLRMKGLPTGGNHIFRRFRMTWLRENSVSPDIEGFGSVTRTGLLATTTPCSKRT